MHDLYIGLRSCKMAIIILLAIIIISHTCSSSAWREILLILQTRTGRRAFRCGAGVAEG